MPALALQAALLSCVALAADEAAKTKGPLVTNLVPRTARRLGNLPAVFLSLPVLCPIFIQRASDSTVFSVHMFS